MERAFVPSSHTHHREVGARLFHEMELELVSLPCQTVNSLGAATRAINPLLVLQFSTQPRTAINNRPLSKVDHNPRRFLVDFQKFHRSPSVALLFFSLSLSLYLLLPLARQEGVPRYWQQRERKLPGSRSRGEGNRSSLIADVGILGILRSNVSSF